MKKQLPNFPNCVSKIKEQLFTTNNFLVSVLVHFAVISTLNIFFYTFPRKNMELKSRI